MNWFFTHRGDLILCALTMIAFFGGFALLEWRLSQ